ncbi:MAG: serine/threonine protein kinase, partial [Myxococcales bacterium]|nr:serine/threonine protein kinase [Myxococcales bacterium]
MDERALRYTLGEELGSGAVATVVRVHDRETGMVYAGKILHTRLARDGDAAERFAREAELVRHLKHVNIVEIHDHREIAGRGVLLMELVEGPTLAELIAREAPIPEPRLLSLARGIADGLAAAHEMGIIHRDLKPANILVSRSETPKIADFGMARATSFAGVDRGAMAVAGTPDYMAPETLDPLAVDPRTDLYALGCILHEMATGAPPFTGATPLGLLEQHRAAPIPSLPEGAPYSPRLRQLITSLLAKQPGDRPQAARAVVEQLVALRGPDGGAALAIPLRRDGDDARRACVRCEAPLVSELAVCLKCGFPQVHIKPGNMALYVTGPGEIADKFDSVRRERLLQWIRRNPGLGLDAAPLASSIPRLPFQIASGISQASAVTLAQSLAQLDIECESARGGRLGLAGVRTKALAIAGRRTAVVSGVVMAPAMFGLWFIAIPMVMAVAPVVFTLAFVASTRPFISARASDQRSLTPAMSSRVRKLDAVVPKIEADRHRESLRAVVSRVFALFEGSPPDARAELDAELARALDVGMLAATRLDALDRALASHDTMDPSAEVRAMLHERDMWSARLLELTATLDAF